MSNKRIQKKRAKAAQYYDRIKFIAEVTASVCPYGTRYEKRRIALALWKLSDEQIVSFLEEFRKQTLRWIIRIMPPMLFDTSKRSEVNWLDTVGYRPSITDIRERTKE